MELVSYIQRVAHAFFSTLSRLIRSKCSLKGGIICSLLQMHYGHTLTGHFIRYTLLVPGLTPFCLQNCLNSSWHRFNKVLEIFLRDFGPY